MFYSKSTNGFYDAAIHGTNIPKDCVEITNDQWKTLMEQQSKGMVIQPNKKGYPVSVDFQTLSVSNEVLIKRFNLATQNLLDATAREWGYDSIISAASYVSSTNAQFKADAKTLISWRDATWDKAYTIEAGEPPKLVEEFLALLPAVPNKPVI